MGTDEDERGRSSEGPPCCSPSARGPIPVPRERPDDRASTRPPGSGPAATLTRLVGVGTSTFRMGTDDPDRHPDDGEGPVRTVSVSPFEIGETAVTNQEFAEFVARTGYRTDAERAGWSFVFRPLLERSGMAHEGPVVAVAPWWAVVAGASWSSPEGPGSHLRDREDHPVVHVSWNDASAYASWAGGRLPTEAEWECAARGGLEGRRFPWGDELLPDGVWRCNIWQGTFPTENSREDGHFATAPVRSFPPNGFGLFEMVGNVWEWCSDRWSVDWHRVDDVATRVDPQGPESGGAHVIRGGSYLCHDSYCRRYRVAARSRNTPDSSAGNMGFRFAR